MPSPYIRIRPYFLTVRGWQTGSLAGTKQQTHSKIETLELSLLQEKRAVAGVEAALSDAKAQRRIQQQLTKVRKHHRFLEGMAGQLSMTVQNEIEEKHKWEQEWNHRLDTFQNQHFELQQGLEKKQLAELRGLQKEFRRSIKKLNDDVALLKSKGRAPSPRALMKVQDGNVEKVVLMFEKHAHERMQVTAKISKQEDMLMKSRTQSLQRVFVEAQNKSENLYRRYNPKQNIKPTPVHLLMDDSQRGSLYSAAASGMPAKPPPLTMRVPPSRRDLHSSRASSHRLPSPRLRVSVESGEMTFSADYFLPGETEALDYEEEDEEAMRDLTRSRSAAPSRISRTVSFDGDDAHAGGRETPASSAKPVASRGSAASTAEMSMVHSSHGRGGGVVTHVHSYGDQTAHRTQNTTQSSTRRPLYAGAHGRLGNNASDEQLAPLPIPGTEQTGWKPIDDKSFTDQGPGRGTNNGGVRPAYLTQVLSSQYRDSSAKTAHGSTTHMGETKRLQKASGAAYRVPADKLGLSMGRTLPTVRSRTTDEKEARRRKAGHSVLDPLGPKAPDWGGVSMMKSSVRKERGDLPPRAASVDQIPVTHRKEAINSQLSHLPARAEEAHASVGNSEKFTQLEMWVEEKIRQVLGERTPGRGVPAPRPGEATPNVQGGRQSTPSGGGRPMHSSTAVPKRLESASSNAAGLLESAPAEKEDKSIGKLLTRLKTTMATDEALSEPADKRKGRPPVLMSAADPMSGMRSEDPRSRAAESAKTRELQTGAEVQQAYDDLEIKGEDKGEPWAVSAAAQDRHDKFSQLDTTGAHRAVTPKTPKRVGFTLMEGEDGGYDAFRPETGYSQQSIAADRPFTGESSAFGDPSRPATGVDSRPDTREAGEEDEEGGERGAVDLEEAKQHFFPALRHNKVAQVEDSLAAGFAIDTRDEHGNTALIVSCQNGHKRLAKLCLKYGANPDATNHQGNTALHYAVSYGYQAMAKYIISHGGDDTIMNLQGKTPYEMTK